MSEKEIRSVLRSLCEDLDRRARRAMRSGMRNVVMPAALGAGLALSGCSDDSSTTIDSGKTDVAIADAGAENVQPPYMAPDAALYAAPDVRLDTAPDATGSEMGILYSAPDGLQPPYMAPDSAVGPEMGLLYMAPDGGVVPPYMAPDSSATDASTTVPETGLLYMAPGPDAGDEP